MRISYLYTIIKNALTCIEPATDELKLALMSLFGYDFLLLPALLYNCCIELDDVNVESIDEPDADEPTRAWRDNGDSISFFAAIVIGLIAVFDVGILVRPVVGGVDVVVEKAFFTEDNLSIIGQTLNSLHRTTHHLQYYIYMRSINTLRTTVFFFNLYRHFANYIQHTADFENI